MMHVRAEHKGCFGCCISIFKIKSYNKEALKNMNRM
jgi:hypothetical protein